MSHQRYDPTYTSSWVGAPLLTDEWEYNRKSANQERNVHCRRHPPLPPSSAGSTYFYIDTQRHLGADQKGGASLSTITSIHKGPRAPQTDRHCCRNLFFPWLRLHQQRLIIIILGHNRRFIKTKWGRQLLHQQHRFHSFSLSKIDWNVQQPRRPQHMSQR